MIWCDERIIRIKRIIYISTDYHSASSRYARVTDSPGKVSGISFAGTGVPAVCSRQLNLIAVLLE